jgi:hypothetical protein
MEEVREGGERGGRERRKDSEEVEEGSMGSRSSTMAVIAVVSRCGVRARIANGCFERVSVPAFDWHLIPPHHLLPSYPTFLHTLHILPSFLPSHPFFLHTLPSLLRLSLSLSLPPPFPVMEAVLRPSLRLCRNAVLRQSGAPLSVSF